MKTLKPMARAKRFRAAAAVLLAISFPFSFAREAAPSEYDVKAVFIFHFASFVEWPADALAEPGRPFVIGVLADERTSQALEKAVRGENVRGHPFEIRRIHDMESARQCHVLYVGRPADRLFAAHPVGAGVLTVGETEEFARAGGMIRFVTENNRVRLRIDAGRTRAAALTVSSKLLRVAEVEKGGGS